MQEAKNREQAAWDEYQASKNDGQKDARPEREIKWNIVKEEKTRPNNPGKPEEGIKYNIATEEATRPEKPSEPATTETDKAKPKHYAASEELADQDAEFSKYDEEKPVAAKAEEKPATSEADAETNPDMEAKAESEAKLNTEEIDEERLAYLEYKKITEEAFEKYKAAAEKEIADHNKKTYSSKEEKEAARIQLNTRNQAAFEEWKKFDMSSWLKYQKITKRPKHYGASEELAAQDAELSNLDEEKPVAAKAEESPATAEAESNPADAKTAAEKTLLETQTDEFRQEKQNFAAQVQKRVENIKDQFGTLVESQLKKRGFALMLDIPQSMQNDIEGLRRIQRYFDKRVGQEEGKIRGWFNKMVERVGTVDDILGGAYDAFVSTCKEIGKGLFDSVEKNRRTQEEKRRLQMLKKKRAGLEKLASRL